MLTCLEKFKSLSYHKSKVVLLVAILNSNPWQKMPAFLGGTWGLNILEKVSRTQFHHQNMLARESDHGIGIFLPY